MHERNLNQLNIHDDNKDRQLSYLFNAQVCVDARTRIFKGTYATIVDQQVSHHPPLGYNERQHNQHSIDHSITNAAQSLSNRSLFERRPDVIYHRNMRQLLKGFEDTIFDYVLCHW
ncbi:hypothetical protein DERF_006912 [Dermatophagoides farinae]|uniref:Uncharacterized protein n=1 Tax=Dermatophagoides farinae TaxID=6954 RepID=A0A922I007_DERFA|nr:hypothetical protein DERF_006912 [Dermatophagoides farinae]